jgi:hypothetical protein
VTLLSEEARRCGLDFPQRLLCFGIASVVEIFTFDDVKSAPGTAAAQGFNRPEVARRLRTI